MLFTPPLTLYLTFPLPTPAVLQKIQKKIHPEVTAPWAEEPGKMEKVACLENGLAGLQLLDDPEAPPTSNQEEGKKNPHSHTKVRTNVHIYNCQKVSTTQCWTTIQGKATEAQPQCFLQIQFKRWRN